MTTSEDVIDFSFCPDHGEPEKGVLWAWSCPDGCPNFVVEIDRRLEDSVVNGNYFEMRSRRGVMMSREFRRHRPVGRWEIVFPSVAILRRRVSRMHSLYRARRG